MDLLYPSQLETVEALLESASLLHSSLDLDDLLRHLLRSVMGRLTISRGLIAVADEERLRLALIRGVPALRTGDEFSESKARENGIERLFPIGDPASPVGVLGVNLPAGREISTDELAFLKALLGIAASGIANARAHDQMRRLNLTLDQKVQDLRTLLDLVRGLTATLEPDEVAQLLVLTLAGRWAVRKCGLLAWKHGHPLVMRMKGIDPARLAEYGHYEKMLMELPEAIRVADLPDCELKEILREEEAAVIFKIEAGDETTGGMVILGPRPGNLSYSEADLEFGTGLVAQAAVAFENSWYFRETIERKRVEQELTLAATIQETLFPAEMPRLPGFDLAPRNRPARHCGGDYYDILPVGTAGGEPRYLICVADVSGKGLPASLLMSNIQATLRALLGTIDSLPDLAARMNELLHASTPSNKYVTAILVDLDPVSGAVRYVNAGHTDCLLRRADGEAVWLKGTGTPLGLIPGMPYGEESLTLHPGDLLALFSDGVTEAQDVDENEFGEGRVVSLFNRLASLPAKEMVEELFDELDRFAGEAPQYDDITLFVIKREFFRRDVLPDPAQT
jgi:sigma-B regulation protein RsbU (phosphoserine phosphatase)